MEDIKALSPDRFTGITYKTVGNCDVEIALPFCLVVFGATGDLARRKLLPSLYRLAKNGLLPDNYFIIGIARSDMEKAAFRGTVRDAVQSALAADFDFQPWTDFSHRLYYIRADYGLIESYRLLKRRITDLEKRHATSGNRIFYLAVPPEIYETVASNLGAAGLSREEKGYAHIVIEKPIGRDLESAKRPDLSNGPLSCQGDGPEHPDVQVREFDLRTPLEQAVYRPCADNGFGDAWGGAQGRIL
jgi:hypothetical protein